MNTLPKTVSRVIVPPIKCQGIKTKLIPFITSNIQWEGEGRWIEPFLGSGVVAFNVQPKRALLNDSNPHIINLYRGIHDGTITPEIVSSYLKDEGARLFSEGETHYYHIRERFNAEKSPLDFLFLSRACFNGLMRFNKRGYFNVPFCRKPDRFRDAYITKIVNQVRAIKDVMWDRDWAFTNTDWRECLKQANSGDFVYLDPPYVGRHTDYYNQWSAREADELAHQAQALPCGIALSMWKANKYRHNEHIESSWGALTERTESHFYHVGSTEDLRNEMIEALLISPAFVVENPVSVPFIEEKLAQQLGLDI